MDFLQRFNKTVNNPKLIVYGEHFWDHILFIHNNGFYTALLSLLFVTFLIIKFSKKLLWCSTRFKLFKNSEDRLGKRQVQDLTLLKDIVLEVHYAACHSSKDRALVRRCKELLQMYPAACNIPMLGHHYTPFLRACWNGCAELISYMIRIGANVEVTTDAGEGAIYLATYSVVKKRSNDFSAIKILLDAGLNINQARDDGLTALDLAALKGHTRLAKWLVYHGAIPCSEDNISWIFGKEKF